MEKIINKKNINIKNNKIISISGVNEKMKSMLTLLIINFYKKDKKILIINMDFLNNDLNNKINNNKNGKNIYYMDGRKIIDMGNNFIKNINNFKKTFDIIIINTSYECFFEYNKKLIQLSDKNYFIIKYNNLELEKSITLFKIYIEKWKIENKKIKLIINNKNKIKNKIKIK